jgi:hypothetical protein
MEQAIILFIFFAILHLVYESIIAPSLRLKLRYELFKLRDRVRSLKIIHGHQFSDVHFSYLEDSINTLLQSLQNFDAITLAIATIAISKDKELQRRAETRAKILDGCAIKEAVGIRIATIAIANKALRVNNGGWFIYLLPLLMVLMFYKTITSSVKKLFSLSERDFNKVTPTRQFAH